MIFDDDKPIVGEDTIGFFQKENYNNCIIDVKKLIGLDLGGENFQNEIKQFPYKIEINNYREKNLEIVIDRKKGDKDSFSPLEICSLIIKKMVRNSENYLQKKINKLIITVPAYFNDNQIEMIRQAAEINYLNVIRILKEPISASIAYGFTKEKLDNKKIMVFDLGGNNFKVTILSYQKEDEQIQILSNSEDFHLGGDDFDTALVEYIIEKSKIKEDIRKDRKAMKILKDRCEDTKKILSNANKTTLLISNIYKDIDIYQRIERNEFEKICQPLFDKLIVVMKKALSDKNINIEEISDIILVGGSTKIPKVKEIINNLFRNRIKIHDSIDPDEVIAYGATLEAEKLLNNSQEIIHKLNIFDMVPFSLGIRIPSPNQEEPEMEIIIKRGTKKFFIQLMIIKLLFILKYMKEKKNM